MNKLSIILHWRAIRLFIQFDQLFTDWQISLSQ